MKLHDYLIRAALAERDWSAAVDAVARHFSAPHIKSLPIAVRGTSFIGYSEIEVFTNRCLFGWDERRSWYEIPKTYGSSIDEEVRIWTLEL